MEEVGSDLVERQQVARRELELKTAPAKLDKHHLLILDYIGYVSKDPGRHRRPVAPADRHTLRALLDADLIQVVA